MSYSDTQERNQSIILLSNGRELIDPNIKYCRQIRKMLEMAGYEPTYGSVLDFMIVNEENLKRLWKLRHLWDTGQYNKYKKLANDLVDSMNGSGAWNISENLMLAETYEQLLHYCGKNKLAQEYLAKKIRGKKQRQTFMKIFRSVCNGEAF